MLEVAGSILRCWEARQGRQHSHRTKARHNRKRNMKISAKMAISGRLRNKVANFQPKTKLSMKKNKKTEITPAIRFQSNPARIPTF